MKIKVVFWNIQKKQFQLSYLGDKIPDILFLSETADTEKTNGNLPKLNPWALQEELLNWMPIIDESLKDSNKTNKKVYCYCNKRQSKQVILKL